MNLTKEVKGLCNENYCWNMLLKEIKIDGNTPHVHELEGLIKKSILLKQIYRFNYCQNLFDLFAEIEATILNSCGISQHSD